MAKEETPQDKFDEIFDVMPGADKDTEAEASLDLNFGLGDEPAEEPVAEIDEDVVAEVEEPEQEEEAPVEEESAEKDAEKAEKYAEKDAEEVVAEAEAEPEPAKDTKMVPKSRLDEVLAKQKALQKQLDDMRKAQEPTADAPEAYDFAAKEREYMNLVLDGKEAEAVQLRQEIRTAEKTQLEFEMSQKMQQTVSQNAQATALQAAANELEANFPVFDQNSADYNADITQEVIDLRDAFIVQGFDAVDALSKAANFVIKDHGLAEEAPQEATLTQSSAPVQDEVAKKRAEVNKKLQAAKSQPPELPGESSAARGEKALDISTMTEDEFNALPEATIKRLRGDLL
jgi:hypothetical protein